MAEYSNTKATVLSYSEAVEKTRQVLKNEGFGIITEIDIKAKLKEKLNIDFPNYIILGACHPMSAYEALQKETEIGLMLPCNVIVYEKEGKVFVSAIKPTEVMKRINNPKLTELAERVEQKLKKAITAI
ncbi:DUF302 domain-containing protein [Candidatus Woesearchaeota archaeon]|nr:DUF302 domain-containing protein [Candidatus Woesearchaeota archaeon]